MTGFLINETITPLVTHDEWHSKYPSVDREYVWIYPLIGSDPFDPAAIFKDSKVPLLSLDSVIYVHVPACLFSCPMCPFYYEIIKDKNELSGYVDSLIKELEMYVDSNIVPRLNLRTIYFGGGTASLLLPTDIGRLIKRIKQLIPFREELEITLECHPGVIDRDYLSAVRDEGVNRISLGIQSFQDSALNIIRRKQTSQINKTILSDAVSLGFKTVSADLIYRIPNQSVGDVISDTKQAIDLGATSISSYSLEFNTTKSNLMNQQPSEEIDREMFYSINDFLTGIGWDHIAQPDYAAPNHLHQETVVTWKAPQGQWFSIGAGAWSSLNNNVYCNVHDMKEYQEVVNRGLLPILAGRNYSLSDAMSRYPVLGTRCFEIKNEPFEEAFGISIFDAYQSEIEMLANQEIISISTNGLDVTQHGKYYVDNISKLFYSENNRCRLQPWGARSKGQKAISYLNPNTLEMG